MIQNITKESVLRCCTILMIVLLVNLTAVRALTISHSADQVTTAGNTATIPWSTDKSAVGKVLYGKTGEALSEAESLAPALEHQTFLDNLEHDTAYQYEIRATALDGEDAVNDNEGSLYSFMSGSGEAPATPEDDLQDDLEGEDGENTREGEEGEEDTEGEETGEEELTPLEVTLPRYHNSNTLTLSGTTEPFSVIKVYVNKPLELIGSTEWDETATSNRRGLFTIRVPLADENNVVVYVEHPDNTISKKSGKVTVDTIPPTLTGFTELPNIVEKDLVFKGSVSEQVTIKYSITPEIGETVEGEVQQAQGTLTSSIPLIPGAENANALNLVKVDFVDRAGNTLSFEKTIVVSPLGPKLIKHNLAGLSPSYAQDVVVKGEATPGATVVVIVDGETGQGSAWSTSLKDAIVRLGRIVQGKTTYETVVGEDGKFEIPVQLTQKTVSENIEFITPGRSDPVRRPDALPSDVADSGFKQGVSIGTQFDNPVEIVVGDALGRTQSSGKHNIVFAKCGFGGDWGVTATKLQPGAVQPEMLRRGDMQLSYNLQLTWNGFGQAVLTNPPSIRRYPLNDEAKKEYLFDPERLVRGIRPFCAATGNYRKCSVFIDMNAMNYKQEALGDLDTEDLLIRIPMMVELRYQVDTDLGRELRTQRVCIDGHTTIDIEVPPSVIPEGMLNVSVSGLTKTIDAINSIKKRLKWMILATWVACAATFLAWVVAVIDEKLTCSDSKDQSPECVESRTSRMHFEKSRNLICDRVFCPTAPTVRTYLEDLEKDKWMDPVMDRKSLCEGQSVPGVYSQEASADFFAENNCRDEYANRHGTACLLMDEWVRSACSDGSLSEPDKKKYCGDDTLATLERAWYSVAGMCVEDPAGKDNLKQKKGKWYYYNGEDKKWYHTTKTRATEKVEGERSFTLGAEKYEMDQNRQLTQAELGTLGFAVPQKENVVDPTSGLLTSVQCACLPAFNGYLSLYRNVLDAVRSCFQEIMVTGDTTGGMCRSILTTYVCDLVIDALGCALDLFGKGAGGRSDEGGIAGFFKALADAKNDIYESTYKRYGNTMLYKHLFNKRQLIHSMCLFAFTHDWDYDITAALTGEEAFPIVPEAFLAVHERRFMNSNPVNKGATTWMYHIGAAVFSNANTEYGLELVCSDGFTCTTEGFEGGRCDCAGRGEQRRSITYKLGPGRLDKQGVVSKDIYELIRDSPYRYDRVRLWFRYMDNAGKVQTDELVKQIEQVGGSPPADCVADATLGFHCDFDTGDRGYATFVGTPVPDKEVYGLGDTINLDVDVEKRSPQQREFTSLTEGGFVTPQALPENQVPFFLKYRVLDQRGREVQEWKETRIDQDGVTRRRIPGVQITKTALLGAGEGIPTVIGERPGVDYNRLLAVQVNHDAVTESAYIRITKANLARQYTCEVGGYTTSSPRFVAPTTLTADAAGTVECGKVKFTINDPVTGGGVGRYFDYTVQVSTRNPVTGRDPDQACTQITPSNPAVWHVELALHYCDDPAQNQQQGQLGQNQQVQTNAPSAFTCTRSSSQQVVYGTQLQAYTGANAIPIKVICQDAVPTPTCNAVSLENKKLGTSDECLCGPKQEICTGRDAYNNYCDTQTPNQEASCIQYNACSAGTVTVDTVGTESRDRCDCDGQGAGASTGMECALGKTCAENTQTNLWSCS